MKAILKETYRVNSLLELQKGETVIIIGEYYGCGCSNSYKCIVPDGTQQFIPQNILEIIDHTPTIDWEQIRIRTSIAAMQGILASTYDGTFKEVAVLSVKFADELIKELLKKNL